MVDCEVQVQVGIYGGKNDGAFFMYDLEKNDTYSVLYDVKSTYTVWSIAVNRQLTEMKASGGTVYRGKPDDYWNKTATLNQGYNLDTYGSLKDGRFVYTSGSMLGSVWIHDDPPTSAPTTANFTNLAANSRTFCNGYYTCILDIAFEGNNYAWSVDGSGYVFISTQKQDKGIGGPVKNIGRIKYYPGGYSWGID